LPFASLLEAASSPVSAFLNITGSMSLSFPPGAAFAASKSPSAIWWTLTYFALTERFFLILEKSLSQPANWKPRSPWSGASGATADSPAFTRWSSPIALLVTESTNFTLYCLAFFEPVAAGAWAALWVGAGVPLSARAAESSGVRKTSAIKMASISDCTLCLVMGRPPSCPGGEFF